MFDIAPSELLVLGTVALLVIPPKDLPKAMRVAGYWVGRARGVARQFRSGFDAMVREAELAELQKQWAEENARIMAEHPMPAIAQLEPEPPVVAAPQSDAHADAQAENLAPVMVAQPAIRDAAPATEAPAQAVASGAKPRRKSRAQAAPEAPAEAMATDAKPKRKPRAKASPPA
jgi:sec-independent protein translocase protein TatB